jgi:LysM repeat protein
MPLERGTYGIEYDGHQRGSGGKLWLLALLIPLIVIVLVLRGCNTGKSGGIYSGDDAALEGRDMPEVQVERERPSLASHFIKSWRNKFRGDEPDGEDGSTDADKKDQPSEKKVDTVEDDNTDSSVLAKAKIPDEVSSLIKRSDELRQTGNLVSARMILEKLRLRPEAANVRAHVEKRLGEINVELILSDKAMPGKILHKIKRGDLVSRLTRRYGNTEEYILRINSIDRPDRIRIGQELWVLDNPVFELMIDKSEFKAVLLFNNRFFKIYTVGLGVPESVPSGTYSVYSRREYQNDLQEARHKVSLRASGDTPAVTGFWLQPVENLSELGRSTDGDGILFSPRDAEELYVLLHAGSTVTIVE